MGQVLHFSRIHLAGVWLAHEADRRFAARSTVPFSPPGDAGIQGRGVA